MWLKVVLALIQLTSAFLSYLERERWKVEGKREANAEALKVHDERIAQANAARADADDLSSLHNDPRNRDSRR
jgi:hypothetical protein